MSVNDWVMSMDNPTRAAYAARNLWEQGIRSGDRVIISLQYGYNDHKTDILCAKLEEMERVANRYLEDYNPDIGF